MKIIKDDFNKGVPVRKVNILMAIITVTISIMLLISTFMADKSYRELYDNMLRYIESQKIASEMQIASDYLTEQVRCFAVTGEIQFVENYFEEVNVNMRRDNSVKKLKESFGGAFALSELEGAMKSSTELMRSEYYSMRLAAAAFGCDISALPQELQAVELLPEDAALSPEEQSELARSMVFDDAYRNKKAEISENMEKCLASIVDVTANDGSGSLDKMKKLLVRQQVLIIVMIAVVVLIVLVTSVMLISPLLKAIWHVHTNQPIPVVGSYEFRYLARTYNLMYEQNREKNEHLAYEAMHDSLTDAYNRNGYDFLLKNIDRDTSVLLIFDIDSFKKVNDTYGHEAGDMAVTFAAKIIKDNFRSQDYVCRIGGDEFTVIMVNANSSMRELIANKVASINNMLQNQTNGLPPLSVSVGVAFGDKKQSFKDADAALYRIKAKGGKGCGFAEQ